LSFLGDDMKKKEHNVFFPLKECEACSFDSCHCLNQDFCIVKEKKLSELKAKKE